MNKDSNVLLKVILDNSVKQAVKEIDRITPKEVKIVINDNLKEKQHELGKFGAFFKNQMAKASQAFSQCLSAGSAAMFVISKTKEAVSELKEINTLLTDIGRADGRLSKSDLEKIGSSSFDIAGRYGKKAQDYLSGVQEAARAGYENAQGIAELSMAAQSACGMTAELSNQMITAVDKAYQMNGSITELEGVLDGMHFISSHNAVDMEDLADAMSAAGSTAASLGVGADEAAAALGAMIAATRAGGTEAADAFKAILLNTRQTADEAEGVGAEGLAAYEDACSALNVKLKETKDGVLSLRAPMEVLAELSAAYNKLEESDPRRTNLLQSVGGGQTAAQLDALLGQWGAYEAMLQQYADGTGSMKAAAEKTADSWEGSMNRIGNTWTDTVQNIVDSDAVIFMINSLNSLLSVVNHVTERLGPLGSIGLGAGIFAGFKNVGRPKMSGLICY